MLRKSQENEKNLRAAEEVLKQSTLTTFILYVALVASFSAVWWPDKSWFQGSMVTAIGWARRTRDLTLKTKPMNQCRFNVKVHRFGFLPQLISMQTTMMAASHRLFEPEMPKVFFIENWLGFSNFVHVFSPCFFCMFLTRKWIDKIMHLKSQRPLLIRFGPGSLGNLYIYTRLKYEEELRQELQKAEEEPAVPRTASCPTAEYTVTWYDK